MTRHQMIQYIKDNYLDMPIKTMARNLGKSGCFVSNIMKKENLTIPTHIVEMRKKESQFQSGHKSWNKGRSSKEYLSDESMSNISRTQFKKGQLPANTKEEGYISFRKHHSGYHYFFIKHQGKMRLLHRVIYEQIHGPLKPGHIVQFSDGNVCNLSLDNLYVITRDKQVILNKNGGKALSAELRQSILLYNDLIKKINEKQSIRLK